MVYFDVRYWHLPADTDNSVLFNDTVNCYDYRGSVMNEWR